MRRAILGPLGVYLLTLFSGQCDFDADSRTVFMEGLFADISERLSFFEELSKSAVHLHFANQDEVEHRLRVLQRCSAFPSSFHGVLVTGDGVNPLIRWAIE